MDEEKRRNRVMPVEEIKAALLHCKGISLNSLKEKKMLIDLLINSVIIQEDGSIDVIFNYREKEPEVPLSFRSLTTPLTWSTA